MSEEKKKEAAPEKAAKAVAEKPAPKPHVLHEAHPHGKKVGAMDLAEINAAIELCQKQMGGLWSRHGRNLAERRAALMPMQQAPVRLKKAA